MSPFDLRGPEFLAFYIVVGAIALALLAFQRRRVVQVEGAVPRVSDPYLLALVRGGPSEAARVAAVVLADRGLLHETAGGHLLSAGSVEATGVVHPLERALLRAFSVARPPAEGIAAPQVASALRDIEDAAQRLRLAPDPAQRRSLAWGVAATVLLLGALGATKLVVALMRGRSNVTFLVMAMAGCCGGAILLGRVRRTSLGDRLLGFFQGLTSTARERAATLRPGASSEELALLAGVHGLAVLPVAGYPLARRWHERSEASSSCGSSSCGSSGGCGGGGGGGCGGCGS